jgi:hypothetical protein
MNPMPTRLNGSPLVARSARPLAGRLVACLLAVATLAPTLMVTTAATAQDEKKKKFRFGDPMPRLDGK